MIMLGIRGQEIGQMLKLLLSLVLEEQLPNEKETLLAYARSHGGN